MRKLAVVLAGRPAGASHRRQHHHQDADGHQHHRHPAPVAVGRCRSGRRTGPAARPHIAGLPAHGIHARSLRSDYAAHLWSVAPCAPAPAARGRRRRGSPTTTPASGCGSMTPRPRRATSGRCAPGTPGACAPPQGWTQVDRRVAVRPRFEPPTYPGVVSRPEAPASGNRWGLPEAVLGFAGRASCFGGDGRGGRGRRRAIDRHRAGPIPVAVTVADVVGLWVGLVGAVCTPAGSGAGAIWAGLRVGARELVGPSRSVRSSAWPASTP